MKKPPLCLILLSIMNANMLLRGSPPVDPSFLQTPWDAQWITHPDVSGEEFGVYLFQREFELEEVPDPFVIHVSADNRYKLYVNGTYICNGPARGDLNRWRFETVDISKSLKTGDNLVCAIVWNFAEHRPMAQISHRTGLIIQGHGETGQAVNPGSTWKVCLDKAYHPEIPSIPHYYVVGPNELFDTRVHPWGWLTQGMRGNQWESARELSPGIPYMAKGANGQVPDHLLYPRDIPLLEETPQRFAAIRRSDIDPIPKNFLNGGEALNIPSRTRATFLLDQGQLTTAYPVLNISGGTDSQIRLSYAESLYHEDGSKGNRNEVEGKTLKGPTDIIFADGGHERSIQPLWWRTFRYVLVEIETADEALQISDIHSIFTAYPFEELASFSSSNPALEDIWDVGWHTQRLCAGETYFDCPYYEQLQYLGDTRIQCLISSYVSGDFRLMRRAITDFSDSRMSFKLTQSRYPSYNPQIIPPFSLYWIVMIHDYWMLRSEPEFVQSMIPGMLDVLQWYEERMGPDGLLGKMEWWNFVDWVRPEWANGQPPGEKGRGSSVINLEFAYAIQRAAEIFHTFGLEGVADHYSLLGGRIQEVLVDQSWVPEKGLLADTPDKEHFSQHANLMAVLTGMFEGREQEIMERVLSDPDLAQCTYYYRFYLAEALKTAGMADQYPDLLQPWQDMLDRGLTTFAERGEPTRSDCHAWSSSPLYHYLSLVCGIRPSEPGFKSVLIEPNLGSLTLVEGRMPHPLGEIQVRLESPVKDRLQGLVRLPAGLTGVFNWKGRTLELSGGISEIDF